MALVPVEGAISKAALLSLAQTSGIAEKGRAAFCPNSLMAADLLCGGFRVQDQP